MKVKLLVLSTQEGVLFLDVNDAPHDAEEYEFVLDGVTLTEAMNLDREGTVWLESENPAKIVVIDVDSYTADRAADLGNHWPIPTPVFCLGNSDYETLRKRVSPGGETS